MLISLSNEQTITLLVIICSFGLFIWDRIRYDLVALMALLVLVLFNIVPAQNAFTNFGHPALISVMAVLILSQAIANTGLTFYVSKYLMRFVQRPSLIILTLSALVAVLSGFMNNVGALALIMPVAFQVAQRNNISISHLLMPLSFASLLGGASTLIGTPPNIIISNYRASLEGKSEFGFFDFTSLGVIISIAGLIYISFLGWRLLPNRNKQSLDQSFASDAYIVEARIAAGSKFINQSLKAIEDATENQISIVALLRGARRILAPTPNELLKEGDLLLIEGQPDHLNHLQLLTDLELNKHQLSPEELQSGDVKLLEVVVNTGARIANRSIEQSNIREYYGVNILGIARQGTSIKQRFSKVTLQAGDILLIQIHQKNHSTTLAELGCLPLKERISSLKPPTKLWPTLVIFLSSILLVTFNILPVHISFPLAASIMIVSKLISLDEAYQSIEGSLFILLGCFITVGSSLETTGLTKIIAHSLLSLLNGLPSFAILGLLLLACMLMTDLINNSAAAVIMAPIAASLAQSLQHSVDPYLIIVTIGCSCAFNTPIGHHCNTLVMGAGGYKFGDYFRMGFLLDIILLCVAVPSTLFFWPLKP